MSCPHSVRWLRVGVLLVVSSLVGCSGSAPSVPVTGKVLLDGKAIQVKAPETATVNYHPDASKSNTSKAIGIAQVKENGEYTVAVGEKDGIAPGWYKVTVTYSRPLNPKDPYSPTTSYINAAYGTPEHTLLSVEVKEGNAAGAYDLSVKK